jgi:hypothetical protein
MGILGSVAGALAGPVLGGLFQNKANKDNEANQREFAQMGIQWKVADAKAAGLHPLYALGGSGATYSPSAQPLMSGADASRAMQSIGQGDLHKAQLRVLEAQAEKDFALASAARSEQARADQAALSNIPAVSPVAESFPVRMPSPVSTADDISLDPRRTEVFNIAHTPQAAEVVPNYLTKDALPAFTRFNVPGFGEMLLPGASSASEALEAIENPVLQGAIVAANVAHYGPGWFRRFVGYLDSQRKPYRRP